jgi:hypothetical protein
MQHVLVSAFTHCVCKKTFLLNKHGNLSVFAFLYTFGVLNIICFLKLVSIYILSKWITTEKNALNSLCIVWETSGWLILSAESVYEANTVQQISHIPLKFHSKFRCWSWRCFLFFVSHEWLSTQCQNKFVRRVFQFLLIVIFMRKKLSFLIANTEWLSLKEKIVCLSVCSGD